MILVKNALGGEEFFIERLEEVAGDPNVTMIEAANELQDDINVEVHPSTVAQWCENEGIEWVSNRVGRPNYDDTVWDSAVEIFGSEEALIEHLGECGQDRDIGYRIFVDDLKQRGVDEHICKLIVKRWVDEHDIDWRWRAQPALASSELEDYEEALRQVWIALYKISDLTYREIGALCGCSYEMPRLWLNGDSTPSPEAITAMADAALANKKLLSEVIERLGDMANDLAEVAEAYVDERAPRREELEGLMNDEEDELVDE